MKNQPEKDEETQSKIVSRKENEEIFYDETGKLTTGGDHAEVDSNPLHVIHNQVEEEVDLDSGQSVDSQHQGIED